MVGSCEQIVSMLSASNEWPQIKEDDEQRSLNSSKKMMITKEEVKAMEKTAASQEPLKCPRCESSNTKFCYYNNYSLSQPRHFCKACKRYWTRGGTLRNVPVGGGCRKNKRFRRNPNFSNPNSSSNNSSSNISDQSNFNSQSLNTNPNGISPLLYGLPTNLVPHEAIINGFPSFSSGYENSNHHLGGVGLGFSSNGMILDHGGARNKQILQELISSSNPNSMSMSSLLTSRFQQHQQKYNFETLLPYELDLQTKEIGCHGDSVKLEETDHSRRQSQIQNRFDQIHQQEPIGDSDSSILWNENHTNWLDPNFSNLGSSSVPSLI